MASLTDCPDEVLLKIFNCLDFDSTASLRRANKRMAEIGSEALVTRLRFFVHEGSLQRLHSVAHHDVLCKRVHTVIFNGNVLGDVGCVHTYSSHYELEHHAHERPQPPGRNASKRERRLYERNMAKWQKDIEKKWGQARKLYEDQQALLASHAYEMFIASSMHRFPRLRKVVLSNVGRCRHVLPDRFIQTYASDCAIPMDSDSSHTKDQLLNLIIPHGKPITTLEVLEAHVVSPNFFTGFAPGELIAQAFKNLKVVNLDFRVERGDRTEGEMTSPVGHYQDLSKGILRDALAAAEDLEELIINFDDFGFYGACTTMENVLGNCAWPRLRLLDVDCMSTTSDYFMKMLKRQPKLSALRIGFIILESGDWPETTRQMRKELHLTTLSAHGLLEDNDRMYSMHLLNSDAYMEDFSEISLGIALDMYVTDTDPHMAYLMGFDYPDLHPLHDPTFVEPEELREEFGPFSDMDMSDDFSDMSCDEE